MNILFVIVPITIGVSILFVIGFLWAVKGDQFTDLATCSSRAIVENDRKEK